MNFLEFEGKDPEDAMSQAASHFNVPQEELEIEIISLGSSGLFGLLGGKKAKIRAAVKVKTAAKAIEKTIEKTVRETVSRTVSETAQESVGQTVAKPPKKASAKPAKISI